MPEDASWSVLPEARTNNVATAAESTAGAVGFRTAALHVSIDRISMRLGVTDKDGVVVEEDAADRPLEFHGNAFRVYKSMPEDEHYFGLGDKPGPLDRRGGTYSMWNTDAFGFQESSDQIYKSIPFFISVRQGRAVGTLFDNHWRSSFDFGKESHTAYSFGSEDGPLDYYVIYGPDAKQVLSAYAWLTGTAPLPPLWSLGFQQSRFSYVPESMVREVANRMRADRIPSDVLYLDIDYQLEHQPFTIDTQKFPHFEQMIADLRKQNFHVVAITDLHIAHLPNHGYEPYDTGMAGDHFVKNPDGSVYVGKVWPGPSVFPDFTRKATRDWWGGLYKRFVDMGISGFWNDMNEPSIFDSPSKTMPENTMHRIDEPGFMKRTATHAEIHNMFGMENSRATYEGLLRLQPNLRPFVLTRATYAGGQRYASTWTGDNSSTWNHMRLSTPMLLNLGLSGFAMAGADVGGFIGTPTPELLTRWIELATFQPIDRDHTNDTSALQEVWVHGPEQEDIRRRYIEERYKLMPYLYTATEEMTHTGLPIVRPLFLEFPNATADRHPFDLDAEGEFLFGRSLLVAPSPYADRLDDYSVALPPGNWFDYWTGDKVHLKGSGAVGTSTPPSPQQVMVHPRLDVLPVYVRGGSILPMQRLVQSTSERPSGPLTLRVYPGSDCRGSLYLDDGVSFDFRKGEFLRMNFTCAIHDGQLVVKLSAHDGSYPAWWQTVQLEVYGLDAAPAAASIQAKTEKPRVSFDEVKHMTQVEIPDDGKGSEVLLQWK
jgi:alpha-glucosidase